MHSASDSVPWKPMAKNWENRSFCRRTGTISHPRVPAVALVEGTVNYDARIFCGMPGSPQCLDDAAREQCGSGCSRAPMSSGQ
jgi:hypothetical protein